MWSATPPCSWCGRRPLERLEEFVEYAKKNPNMITVGNSGAGGGVHLVALAFEKAGRRQVQPHSFLGRRTVGDGPPGRHVNAVSVSPPKGFPRSRPAKLKIIALFAEKRLAMFPDVPTVKEQGIDFIMGMWRGLVAPRAHRRM